MNGLHTQMLTTLLDIPLDWDRVKENADKLEPGMCMVVQKVHCDFTVGNDLPKGALQLLSPPEVMHSYVHAAADSIRRGDEEKVQKRWAKTLGSMPMVSNTSFHRAQHNVGTNP